MTMRILALFMLLPIGAFLNLVFYNYEIRSVTHQLPLEQTNITSFHYQQCELTVKPSSTHWIVFEMALSERETRYCDFIPDYFKYWTVIVYDDSHLYFLQNNGRNLKCEFTVALTLKVTGKLSGKRHAFFCAIENGAAIIQTATLDRQILPRRRYGSSAALNGEMTTSSVLDYFNCSSTHQEIGERFSEAALVSNAILYNVSQPVLKHCQKKSCYFADCNIYTYPVRIDRGISQFVGLDLDNAQFDKNVFWALPVVHMNAQDLLIWSQIIFQLIDNANQQLLISSAEVLWHGTTVKLNPSKFDKSSTLHEDIALRHFNSSSKQRISLQSLLYRISTSDLSVSTKKEMTSWILSIRQDAKKKSRTSSKSTHHLQHRFQNDNLIVQLYKDTCSTYGLNINIHQPWVTFESIVLVIVFNNAFYSTIPYLELLYRPFFPHIFYCMPSNDRYQEKMSINFKFSVIYYDSNATIPGIMNHICVYKVQQLNLQTEGYFFLSDDILLSWSVIKLLPLSLPALPHIFPYRAVCDMQKPDADKCLSWIHFSHGSAELTPLYRYYEKVPSSLPFDCMQKLKKITGFQEPLLFATADIYYIPDKYMYNASQLMKAYYEYQVFHEIATAHTLTCLTFPNYPTPIYGYLDWTPDRDLFYKQVPDVTSDEIGFYHPAKLSYVKKGEAAFVKSLCSELLPYYHNGY